MKVVDVVASVAVHVAVIGVGAYALSPTSPQPATETEPIFFELVEASALESSQDEPPPTQPQPEQPRTLPPPSPPNPPAPQETLEPLDALEPTEDLAVPNVPTVPTVPNVPNVPAVPMPEDALEQPDQETASTIKQLEHQEPPLAPPATPSLPQPSAPPAEEEHAHLFASPYALNRIVPSYPRTARRRGHEGSVSVEIVVSEDGGVENAKIVASSGHPELDKAALDAVRTASFAPATEDGANVQGRLRLTFEFKLQ